MSKDIYDVIIIGAGFSGLISANYAKQHNLNYKILEATDHIGGLIQTQNINSNIYYESGPNSMRIKDSLYAVCQELDLPLITSPLSKKIKIYSNNELHSIYSLLDWSILKLLINTPLAITDQTSVYDFFEHHCGQHITNNIIQAIFNGIYSTDIKTMPVSSIIKNPQLLNSISLILTNLSNTIFKKSHNHTATFAQGLTAFIQKISEYISLNNIQLNTTVKSCQYINNIWHVGEYQAKNIIITVPSYVAYSLHTSLHRLKDIQYSTVNTIICKFPNFTNKFLQNYVGWLSSNNNDDNILSGVLHSSSIFPELYNNTQDSYITAFQKVAHNSQAIIQHLANLYNCPNIDIISINNYKQALPQYNFKHSEVINNLQLPTGLHLVNNYSAGISFEDITNLARLTVGQLKESLKDKY